MKLETHYPTNEGDIAIVLEYISYECVWVTFKDTNTPSDFKLKCQLGDLRRGRVKNPYKRKICGVGYKGVGPYVPSVGRNTTKCWHVWRNMISRCYDENNKSYQSYGAVGVTVCEDWHNFQNFAEWYYENFKEGWEIDKDIFGGDIYSPESCVMIPKELNNFFKRKTLQAEDNGIHFDKAKNSYVAQITHQQNHTHLGRFKIKEDAINAFRKEKQKLMKSKLAKFEEKLDIKVLTKLKELIDDYN